MSLDTYLTRNIGIKAFQKKVRKAIIKKAFNDGTHRIFAECDPCNTSSWRLLESLGFIKEAHFLKNVYFWTHENGEPIWKATFVYSLLNN